MISKETKILVVDDFELFRNVIKKALNELGFSNILESDNGKDALTIVQDSAEEFDPVGLMFLDWNMPGVQGIEVLSACKTSQKLRDTKIIMVTAEGEKKQVLAAFHAGVDDYIVKPCNKEIIHKKIKSLIERTAADKAV